MDCNSIKGYECNSIKRILSEESEVIKEKNHTNRTL